MAQEEDKNRPSRLKNTCRCFSAVPQDFLLSCPKKNIRYELSDFPEARFSSLPRTESDSRMFRGTKAERQGQKCPSETSEKTGKTDWEDGMEQM